jgi:hypothetical protein
MLFLPLGHWAMVLYVTLVCVAAFGCIWWVCWRNLDRGAAYFDPQDFVHYEGGRNRELPKSAEAGTFAPLMKQYVGVTKLLINPCRCLY